MALHQYWSKSDLQDFFLSRSSRIYAAFVMECCCYAGSKKTKSGPGTSNGLRLVSRPTVGVAYNRTARQPHEPGIAVSSRVEKNYQLSLGNVDAAAAVNHAQNGKKTSFDSGPKNRFVFRFWGENRFFFRTWGEKTIFFFDSGTKNRFF